MLVTAGLVVALGALVQGAVGYGMALVASPLLALLEPALVPVPLLLLTSGHAVLAAVRDWRHADWTGIGWATLGRLPGTGLGVLAVVALSQRVFAALVGLGVLGCVLLSLLRWRPRPRPGSLLLAGLVSGAGGTVASIGGPPIALLYQEAAGPRIRGTISGYFVLGSVISLAALAAAGQITSESLTSTVMLVPFLLVGFALSGPARQVLDNGWTRRAVLAVAAFSAALLVGHVMLSSG
ncbi:MAG TPA: sulfite exporter TauE/SafE family protein [Pseudonocardiaceae bacterium]|nr:sulfite exporter TauE/SafE family protein [Pseudonocardiaceae bacterium]